MIKAVLFDMYETLVTHYNCALYFGTEMAKDAGVEEAVFLSMWRKSEEARTLGNVTFEDVVRDILCQQGCYTKKVFDTIVQKRRDTKTECFRHLHEEILPMLEGLKRRGVLTGVISNCYREEADSIRESILYPYFNAVLLSCEQGIKKPDAEIYRRCIRALSVEPEECLYIGDGGSCELEAAKEMGMHAMQAAWYIKKGTTQNIQLKKDFIQLYAPAEILLYL